MDTQHRTVPLTGTSLSYHVTRPSAAGTPVVLLHPWFGCWQFWTSTTQHLSTRPCYAVDLYSPAAGEWSAAGPATLADAVVAMMDAEGLDRIDLVGNSVGGIVSQVVASTVPDRVRRLVLVGTGASTKGSLPGFAQAVDRWIATGQDGGAASRGAAEETVGMLFTGRPDPATWETYVQAVLRTDPAYVAAVLGAARRLDLLPRLGRITAPTLVIRGSEDRARTAEHSAALVAGIPTARSVEMPGAGHSPMVDRPDRFAALVAAHLDGEIPRGNRGEAGE
ncbi:alpha/beta hydrolase [Streptomyces sp. NBC_01754]|uniref:alpha/beta fold hydrolase n=1 Tax=Streptomyces sp. NBC_01754 TaxID=2975930 RepID=UPI002DDAE71F|nr:alpha/beta fold hydrolase [Streptomyces sp. NBC_01754]WSC93491.1 alpha/beta hydrolase [Streptomyces sp. NBC_01754]